MIITIFVFIYLLTQTISGYRIGFTRRIIRLAFWFGSLFIATTFNQPLGQWISFNFMNPNTLTDTPNLVARFLAFILVMVLGRIIAGIFNTLFPAKTGKKNIISKVDHLFGGLVALLIAYFTTYLVLSMLNALQINWFIQQTIDSPILQYIIYETPMLSQNIFKSIFGVETTMMNLS